MSTTSPALATLSKAADILTGLSEDWENRTAVVIIYVIMFFNCVQFILSRER